MSHTGPTTNPCSEISIDSPKIETLEQRVEQRIFEHKKVLQILIDYLELIKKCPLKEGDFCFHKEYGKGIIKKLSPGDGIAYNKMLDVGIGEAVIVTISGERKVRYADIIPFSEMSEVLYERSNE